MYKLSQKQGQLNERIREILSRCAETVHQRYSQAQIILYGSHARGDAYTESDMDILILLDSELTPDEKNQLHDMLYEIGLEYDLVISILIKSTPYWESPISQASPLYKSIQDEGILVA